MEVRCLAWAGLEISAEGNKVVVDLPPRQPPSPLPAGADPRQAAAAAKLLQARQVVPIHYGQLHEAANYVQAGDPSGTLLATARELGVEARILQPGEQLRLESHAAPAGKAL